MTPYVAHRCSGGMCMAQRSTVLKTEFVNENVGSNSPWPSNKTHMYKYGSDFLVLHRYGPELTGRREPLQLRLRPAAPAESAGMVFEGGRRTY